VVERVAQLVHESEGAEEEKVWEACDVVLVDEALARVYARSQRCRKEFVDYHENLRTAIALGRHMQVRRAVKSPEGCMHGLAGP
jgi:transcriptional accessory protein Tex/SPT6